MLLSDRDGRRISTAAFKEATGWDPKPQGLCQGEVCVPSPGALLDDGTVDVDVAAARLGMPVVRDDLRGITAYGPATLAGHTLTSAEAADPELLTRDGRPFRLSSLRGRKIVLHAWASY